MLKMLSAGGIIRIPYVFSNKSHKYILRGLFSYKYPLRGFAFQFENTKNIDFSRFSVKIIEFSGPKVPKIVLLKKNLV